MEPKITIKFEGEQGTGKTLLMRKIAQFLRDHGVAVEQDADVRAGWKHELVVSSADAIEFGKN